MLGNMFVRDGYPWPDTQPDLYILLSFRVADIFPENLPTSLAMHSYAFSCITLFFCTLPSLFMRKKNITNNSSFSDDSFKLGCKGRVSVSGPFYDYIHDFIEIFK